jgi:hypothetical protein
MIMRALLSFAAALICLAGCAATGTGTGTPSTYGNFIAIAPAAHEKQLADDAARQLLLLYPPASTRLVLRQASADGFGKQLVELLRSQGYALQEVQPPVGMLTTAATPAPTPAANAPDAAASVAFNYVLDTIASPKLYRVTLVLGGQIISRAYVPQSDAIHPAGAWVRKE